MLSIASLQFIRQHQSEDIRTLALQAHSLAGEGVDIPMAIKQIAGRQSVKSKIPSWFQNEQIIYPQHLSLEQCSSETTAKYKAGLLSGQTFADLTGGFGVDCVFIAEKFQSVIYVEKQEELCKIAEHNFSCLGYHHIKIVQANAIEYLECLPTIDCIFLDPARRSQTGKKTIAIHDCEPDVSIYATQLLETASTVMVKLSPMLDISLALQTLPHIYQIHVVSVNNECKELLFILKKEYTEEPDICCVNLQKNTNNQFIFAFKRSQEKNIHITYAPTIKQFLYEPNASLLKAGAYKIITSHYPVEKLHPDTHLFTSQEYIPDFPGRAFLVQSVFSLNKHAVKQNLKDLSQANITVRNFPISVAELHKRFKLKDGGATYLFAATMANSEKVIIRCEKSLPLINDLYII